MGTFTAKVSNINWSVLNSLQKFEPDSKIKKKILHTRKTKKYIISQVSIDLNNCFPLFYKLPNNIFIKITYWPLLEEACDMHNDWLTESFFVV